jgi:uncharacterized protein involved in exopolysaccharide biosynthesis
MSGNQNSNQESEVFQITPGEVFSFFRRYSLMLIIAGVSFSVLGIAYSFTLPRTYKAQTVLLPEYGMGESTGSSFMKAAMGLNNTDGAEKLVPTLYPRVLQSVPFGIHILGQPITDQDNRSYKTLKEYFERQYSPGLISKFLPSKQKKEQTVINLKNKNILSFTQSEKSLIESACRLVTVEIAKSENVINIGCEMKDPVVAAMLVEAGEKYLVKYVEDYRTSKGIQQMEFLTQRVAEARKRQQSAEYALNAYRDRNRNSFLNVARIEEQRLQADFTLAQSLYSDLVLKLEQSRIKVKEEKPVFKILEPVTVPLQKSGPNRKLLGIGFGFIGTLLTLLYLVFIREKYHKRLFLY